MMPSIDLGKDHMVGGVINPAFNPESRSRVSISSEGPLDLQHLHVPYHHHPHPHQPDLRDHPRPPPRRSILHNSRSQSLVSDTIHENHTTHINLSHLQAYAAKTKESWWHSLCLKVRKKETGPGWEPQFWQKVFPYPYFPTFRHCSRTLALLLIIMMTWTSVYAIMGKDIAPGGQLFDIVVVIIAGFFGGYLFRLMNLPGLAGTLFAGIIWQNLGLINIHGEYTHVSAIMRKVALVIILTRAGLDLDPVAMKSLFGTTLKVGLVPWAVEGAMIAILSHLFLGLPWMWGVLLGGLMGAVSPAVVVGGLMRLRAKGYGVAKGIPTVVIAISGIDDAASVAAFGITQSIMFSANSLLYNLTLGPLSVVGGVGFGVLWGLLSKFVPESSDPFCVPLRILMLLGGGMVAVFGSELVNLEGAGPLGVVAAAFVSSWIWSTQGWDVEDNPVATAYEIFWMVFEPVLFALTGTQIKFNEIDFETFKIAVIVILIGCVVRVTTTVVVEYGGVLNFKEKIFISICCLAKASVQAALGPAALDIVMRMGGGSGPEHAYAKTVLIVCVLSIVLTAPTAAIIIYLAGPHLLTKTSPGPSDRLRQFNHRPSMRDISIVDGGKEEDDLDRRLSIISERRRSSVATNRKSSSRPSLSSSHVTPPNSRIEEEPEV